MSVKAYYGTRRGGSGCRPIPTAQEAEKILKGGYGVTTVRLVNKDGDVIGQRWLSEDRWGKRWLWSYEGDAFQ